MADRKFCTWRHSWSKYTPPQVVTNSSGEPELAQRRECERCAAVDYRRVMVHN